MGMSTKLLLNYANLSIILLIVGFWAIKNSAGQQDKYSKQGLIKEDTITVYKKGKVSKLLSDAEYFKELKDEIENFVANIDDTYRLIPSEARFNRLKRKGYALELVYSSPKELKIDFLASPIIVSRIFIPLSGDSFPSACVFIYEVNKNLPRIFANTKQNKDKLLERIKRVN